MQAISDITGLKGLWTETLGDRNICIAVLDGTVDRAHPSLACAALETIETLASDTGAGGLAHQHGTHIASIIFSQHDGPVRGIAPHCRGLIVPVFGDRPEGPALCSQLDLARAITQAVEKNAQIINLSGGEYTAAGAVHPLLEAAVQLCAARGVLLIAAAGNDGCACAHVPAGLPSVLAVGAMDDRGEPLGFSNWDRGYRDRGILAPGENIAGALPGGGVTAGTGTSYATAIVSGVAALLLSLQRKRGQTLCTATVRDALLGSAIGCQGPPDSDCERVLAGRLNIEGAMDRILQGAKTMDDEKIAALTPIREAPQGAPVADPEEASVEPHAPMPRDAFPGGTPVGTEQRSFVRPSDAGEGGCRCGGTPGTSGQLVYALGQLGYDFGSEARRDSIGQHMDGNPDDPLQLLDYLDRNPSDAETITWLLKQDATPIYAIRPQGAFAGEGYQRLRQFLREQVAEGTERISVGGSIGGKAVLQSGQAVPAVRPELRCMYSWTTTALVESASGKHKPEEKTAGAGVRRLLERVYNALRNLGIAPEERALNYAATNILNAVNSFKEAAGEKFEFDGVSVERSPICRPASECLDVKLSFFDPDNVLRARRVFLYTIDVSGACPVMVGTVRSWSER